MDLFLWKQHFPLFLLPPCTATEDSYGCFYVPHGKESDNAFVCYLKGNASTNANHFLDVNKLKSCS